ncbi:hypothetical protein GOBAR_AA39870 [Gossypium barbadense]|uniref:Uncharacterized protein n=1 Tax=Gossypium barbadense TaxID=3634 RepID=A0A2P5VPS9_GOSBA|nr:hypothetical protein GOBAR_AA39870 [Gossypium barbadense]
MYRCTVFFHSGFLFCATGRGILSAHPHVSSARFVTDIAIGTRGIRLVAAMILSEPSYSKGPGAADSDRAFSTEAAEVSLVVQWRYKTSHIPSARATTSHYVAIVGENEVPLHTLYTFFSYSLLWRAIELKTPLRVKAYEVASYTARLTASGKDGCQGGGSNNWGFESWCQFDTVLADKSEHIV